jgi:hypothetical protein
MLAAASSSDMDGKSNDFSLYYSMCNVCIGKFNIAIFSKNIDLVSKLYG